MGVAPDAYVDQSSRILTQLNFETRSQHAAADEPWLALQRSTLTAHDYLRQLVTAYGFEGPLEAALAYTPAVKLLIDLRQRSRAGLIAQDVIALGLSPSELAKIRQFSPLEPFRSPLEALGWMYVAERSTWVHDAIRPQVVARLPVAATACTYLSAYEGVTGTRWSELGELLERLVSNTQMLDELISAAHCGFAALIEWSCAERGYRRPAAGAAGARS